MDNRFSPRTHVPHYTRHLLKILRTPILVYFALIGNIILFSLMFLFYLIERGINPNINSLFDSLWWGLATVTTVGYGDIIPVTIQGKVVSMLLMVCGVIFFVSFTAILVTLLLSSLEVSHDHKIIHEIKSLKKEIQDLKEEIKSR
jgi:voltage-gated potassium channel